MCGRELNKCKKSVALTFSMFTLVSMDSVHFCTDLHENFMSSKLLAFRSLHHLLLKCVLLAFVSVLRYNFFDLHIQPPLCNILINKQTRRLWEWKWSSTYNIIILKNTSAQLIQTVWQMYVLITGTLNWQNAPKNDKSCNKLEN